MYRNFRDGVEFLVVYVQEAHPTDKWQMPSNVRDQVLLADPTNLDERIGAANLCVRKLGIEIPAVVDEADNRTERAYTAWPDRLYLIDRDGRVAYKSGPGPFGFKPAELESALRRVLGS